MEAMEAEMMYTHCKRCNGKLTAKASMRKGYGPVCAKKVGYGQSINFIPLLNPTADSSEDVNFMDELEERRKAI